MAYVLCLLLKTCYLQRMTLRGDIYTRAHFFQKPASRVSWLLCSLGSLIMAKSLPKTVQRSKCCLERSMFFARSKIVKIVIAPATCLGLPFLSSQNRCIYCSWYKIKDQYQIIVDRKILRTKPCASALWSQKMLTMTSCLFSVKTCLEIFMSNKSETEERHVLVWEISKTSEMLLHVFGLLCL
jgi:hypothetical protein